MSERQPKAEQKDSIVEGHLEQLFEFLDAVHDIKKELANNPNMELEEAMQIVESYNFRSRQEKYFRDGVTELFRRRKIVAQRIKAAKEKYRENFAKGLFQEIFRFEPQGKIKIVEDENSIIFLCHDSVDLQKSFKINSLDNTEADIPNWNQVLNPYFTGPGGVTLRGPGIGEFSGMTILINTDAIQEQEENPEEAQKVVEMIIDHEKQHAENSLFYRPLKDTQKEVGDQLSQIDELAAANIREYKLLAQKENRTKENIERAITNSKKFFFDFEKIISPIKKSMEEAIIKDELIAYAAAKTNPKSFVDIINIQYSHTVERFRNILRTWSDSSTYTGDKESSDYLMDLHWNRLQSEYIQISDRAKELEDEVEQMAKMAADAIELAQTEEMFDKIWPLLISQPIKNWQRIIDAAIRRREAQPEQKVS